MIGSVATFTVIHVAPRRLAPVPYAVVVVDVDGRRVVARADGDVAWLRIGASADVVASEQFGAVCAAVDHAARS